MALVEKVRLTFDHQGWLEFWLNSNFIIWPNLDSLFWVRKGKGSEVKEEIIFSLYSASFKASSGNMLTVIWLSVYCSVSIWVAGKMHSDVLSRCGTLAKWKQDRGINQGKQTLLLSAVKIALCDFQTRKLGVISRMYGWLFFKNLGWNKNFQKLVYFHFVY